MTQEEFEEYKMKHKKGWMLREIQGTWLEEYAIPANATGVGRISGHKNLSDYGGVGCWAAGLVRWGRSTSHPIDRYGGR